MGQVCAFVITMTAIITAAYLALHGQQIAASTIGLGAISGIVTTFIIGRRDAKQEAEQESDPPAQQGSKKSKRQRR